MWAVSCFFKPCRYELRVHNHRLFRARLGVPLLTIELSHDDHFELADDDADVVLRRTCPDVLWQKERLLNLAFASLPAACAFVAWFDGDVVLARDDWADEAQRRLRDDAVLLHLFDRCTDLPRDVVEPRGEATGRSFVALHEEGGHEAELFDAMWGSHPTGAGVQRKLSSGFAWAARRELLEGPGLYDACILGSGDRAIACAAHGRAERSTQNFLRNDAQRAHYFDWGHRFAAAVDGRIGFLAGDLYHLWHGDLANRGYRTRWADFAAFDFDPARDIAVDTQGCWRWATDKPAMHAFVRDYFARRKEDG